MLSVVLVHAAGVDSKVHHAHLYCFMLISYPFSFLTWSVALAAISQVWNEKESLDRTLYFSRGERFAIHISGCMGSSTNIDQCVGHYIAYTSEDPLRSFFIYLFMGGGPVRNQHSSKNTCKFEPKSPTSIPVAHPTHPLPGYCGAKP
jgi:hypothetical protein